MDRKTVLFICTHNSARSQMAESILRKLGGDRYEVMSAGTHPTRVHPQSLKVLGEKGYGTEGLRSKMEAGDEHVQLNMFRKIRNELEAWIRSEFLT